MQINRYIPVIHNGKPLGDAHLLGSHANNNCTLTTTVSGKTYISEGKDYFVSLQHLRRQLETQNIALLCNGARKDVWPTITCRTKGEGIYAYICEPGHENRKMVNIFDTDESMEYSDVEDQINYCRSWFNSLSNRQQHHLIEKCESVADI
jgi:hypothetical protein